MKHALYFFLFLILTGSTLSAQNDSTSWASKQPDFVTFHSTRFINMHTVETNPAHTLEFRISHRFGPINSGAYQLFGIDGGASIRLALEYSINDRLQIGLGHSNVMKMSDGFVKYRLMQQKESGPGISITALGGLYRTALKDPFRETTGFNKYGKFYSRFSYSAELLVARRFSEKLSVQIAPWFVHYNMVDKITDLNDMYGVAAGMRLQVAKNVSLLVDYAFRINDYSRDNYYNSLGAGIEIETSGHRFDIVFTNSFGLLENQYLCYTNETWSDGGIRSGFNITRTFGGKK